MRFSVFAIAVAAVLLPSPVRAQQPCDPDLQVKAGEQAYRQRGDRCEGLFAQQVSGTVRIASVQFPRRGFQPTGSSLRLGWSLPPGSQVYVRAVSLVDKTFFRMDTIRPAGSTSYAWPIDFLETINLKVGDVGLLSWSDLPIGSRTQRIYSPVSVRDSRSGDVEVVLIPEVPLRELSYSLYQLDAQGRVAATVFADREPELTLFSASAPLTITLPALEPKRIYRIEVAGLPRSGGAFTRDIYIVNYQE